MFSLIYVEEEIWDHPETQAIKRRFPKLPVIKCERFGEVFNRKNQSFRLQKENPALILAKKQGNLVLKVPEGHGIGGTHNYYFSHMLNCVFDCRYCFLQGMYSSAHYVLFINVEDFKEAILKTAKEVDGPYFFSGYDCDSLALENITGFLKGILPVFREIDNAFLELRTKSVQIKFLLEEKPIPNCITAFTLSPEPIAKALEHKAPSFKERLKALKRLQEAGWPIGLRFDPVIYMTHFKECYEPFFEEVFHTLEEESIHSVTLGAFRSPSALFKRMEKMFPEEKLFAQDLEEKNGLVTYRDAHLKEIYEFSKNKILKYIPESKLFTSMTF